MALGVLVASFAVLTGTSVGNGTPATRAPKPLHFVANADITASGHFAPRSDGFNLADVDNDPALLKILPHGVKGLVWVGQCNGANSTFRSAIRRVIGNPRVFGFYLMDEPDVSGKWSPQCPAANLKAESDWIHRHDPGPKTFIVLMNMAGFGDPTFANTYNPASSHIDLYGIDPYPCGTERRQCRYSMINHYVRAAEKSGVPKADIVPVYQAFGGGNWVDGRGGAYRMPTASEEKRILARWASVVPSPIFDYAYSWGRQNGDQSLRYRPALRKVFAAHNHAK